MKAGILAAIAAALALSWTGIAHGKVPTAQITVSGPGIEGEIASRAPDAIAPSVWAGDFALADAAVPEPLPALLRHLVRFYINAGKDGLRLVYAVEFVWDAASQRALVHLPGPGEPWHRLNIGTIIHDGSDGSALRDGRWYRANEEWARAVRAMLQAS